MASPAPGEFRDGEIRYHRAPDLGGTRWPLEIRSSSATRTAATSGSATPRSCPPIRGARSTACSTSSRSTSGRETASSAAVGARPRRADGRSRRLGDLVVVGRPGGVRPHRDHGPGQPVRRHRRGRRRGDGQRAPGGRPRLVRPAPTTTARPAASAWRAPVGLTGVDATGGTTGVVGRGALGRRPGRVRPGHRRPRGLPDRHRRRSRGCDRGRLAGERHRRPGDGNRRGREHRGLGGRRAGDGGPGVVERGPRARCALRGRRRPLRDGPPHGPRGVVGAGERRDGKLRRAEPAEHRPRGRHGTKRHLSRRARAVRHRKRRRGGERSRAPRFARVPTAAAPACMRRRASTRRRARPGCRSSWRRRARASPSSRMRPSSSAMSRSRVT